MWYSVEKLSQTGLWDVCPSQTRRRLRNTRELVVTPALSTGAITEQRISPWWSQSWLGPQEYSQSVGSNLPRTGTLLGILHLISTTCRNSGLLVRSDLSRKFIISSISIPVQAGWSVLGTFCPQQLIIWWKTAPQSIELFQEKKPEDIKLNNMNILIWKGRFIVDPESGFSPSIILMQGNISQ